MASIRCPFCHEYISEEEYPAHADRHLQRRDDGQQTDYATLPPDERAEGSLEGVPRVYVHRKCGEATRMPEEIIRSYLANPWLYSADATFCCGCGDHVPFAECKWVETGENLQRYMDRLRAADPSMKPSGCLGAVLLFVGTGVILAAARYLLA
jgi:hypothetical protein